MITLELLQKVCPKTKKETLDKFVVPLNEIGPKYGLFDNNERIACFIAQIAHESGSFNYMEENLNYSAKGLLGVFKKYFPTEELAKQYERQPEKIASRVYANRMGNGPEESKEGFKFKGRGLIQLTGKDNYTKFAKAMEMPIDDAVEYLKTVKGAVESAAWFWGANKLNDLCDKNDFITLTKRINGGTIGLEDRKHHYDVVKEALK
jgi:putative chitinase